MLTFPPAWLTSMGARRAERERVRSMRASHIDAGMLKRKAGDVRDPPLRDIPGIITRACTLQAVNMAPGVRWTLRARCSIHVSCRRHYWNARVHLSSRSPARPQRRRCITSSSTTLQANERYVVNTARVGVKVETRAMIYYYVGDMAR